jgi:hypothetical protein
MMRIVDLFIDGRREVFAEAHVVALFWPLV